jgi:hypothetical protein
MITTARAENRHDAPAATAESARAMPPSVLP